MIPFCTNGTLAHFFRLGMLEFQALSTGENHCPQAVVRVASDAPRCRLAFAICNLENSDQIVMPLVLMICEFVPMGVEMRLKLCVKLIISCNCNERFAAASPVLPRHVLLQVHLLQSETERQDIHHTVA